MASNLLAIKSQPTSYTIGIDGQLAALTVANAHLSLTGALGTVRAITGQAKSTGTGATTGNLVGVRGACTLSGTSTGQTYFYGTQGKFLCTGTLNGSAWSFGLAGQVDLSTATLTAGSHVGAIWGDMGATAPSGACTFADNLVLTNTTAMILNSHIYAYGKAAYFLDLSANSSACVDATSHGSTAAGRIKIKVDGADRYLHVFSD